MTRLCPRGHDRDVGVYRDPSGKSHGCAACKRQDSNTTHARTALRRFIERRSKRKAANRRDTDRLEALRGSEDDGGGAR